MAGKALAGRACFLIVWQNELPGGAYTAQPADPKATQCGHQTTDRVIPKLDAQRHLPPAR